jgi:hypothetical protein
VIDGGIAIKFITYHLNCSKVLKEQASESWKSTERRELFTIIAIIKCDGAQVGQCMICHPAREI